MILIEGTNPFGKLAATVEDDGRTVYLYLHHTEQRDWGFRALWVTNRLAAPEGEDEEARRQGIAPRVAKEHTVHPEGTPELEPSRLSLEWFEEGDGVALLLDDEILAVLLPEPLDNGAPGVSRHARVAGRYAAPLEGEGGSRISERVREGQATWRAWGDSSAWPRERDAGLAVLESTLGPHAQYFSADGGKFPPLAIARFGPSAARHASARGRDAHVWSTLGMALFPMPKASGNLDTAPRIEILMAADGENDWAPQILAWLGRYPWTHYAALGDGHIIAAPVGQASWFPPERSAVLLVTSESLAAVSSLPHLPARTDVHGRDVKYLWAMPITMDERRSATVGGATMLRDRLVAQGREIATVA